MQGDPVSDIFACRRELRCPVDTQRVAARCRHISQQWSSAFRKQDHRHAPAVVFAHKAINNCLHAGQRETTVVVGLECGAPSIEYHDCLGTGFDLRIQVIRGRVCHRAQQAVERRRIIFSETLDSLELAA